MEQINTLINIEVKKSKITSERQFILSEALKRINAEREGTKYKKLTGKGIALLTAHLKLPDLKFHHYQCAKVANYSRLFFGLLKKK